MIIRYALDLELEQPKSNPQTPDSQLDSPRIIQVGVAFFNIRTGEIVETKSWYINIGVPLSAFIKELTSTTQDQLDTGTTIETAYAELLLLIKAYKCFRQPITWGGGDLRALQDEVGLSDLGHVEMNVKTVYQAYAQILGWKRKIGLSGACERLGLSFIGRPHDAVNDAVNTARIYHYFMQRLNKSTSL